MDLLEFRGLFQPKWFHDSLILEKKKSKEVWVFLRTTHTAKTSFLEEYLLVSCAPVYYSDLKIVSSEEILN